MRIDGRGWSHWVVGVELGKEVCVVVGACVVAEHAGVVVGVIVGEHVVSVVV